MEDGDRASDGRICEVMGPGIAQLNYQDDQILWRWTADGTYTIKPVRWLVSRLISPAGADLL